jgi:hypothetical protein
MTSKAVQAEQGSQRGQAERDRQKGIGRRGQAEQDRQSRTVDKQARISSSPKMPMESKKVLE